MMRDVGRSLGDALVENVGRTMGRAQEQKPLPVDLLESDDAFLAVFDAPGTTSSDVQVRLQDGRLDVRVDRFREFYEDFEMRYPGRGLSLDGSVELPADVTVEADEATATLHDNGTLEVRVPKATHDAGDGASDDRADGEETDESETDGDDEVETEGDADANGDDPE